jgi:hypothetical protein
MGRQVTPPTASDRLTPRAGGWIGRRLLALAAVPVVVLLAGTPAFAFWHSTGSGTGAVTTTTLATPTSVTVPATSGASVPVSWTGSSGTPSPTGYYVTRTSGSTVAACGSSASSLIAGTSCTDSAVSNGSYTYTVIAVYRSWDATSTASGSVTVVSATKLVFTTQPSNVVSTVAITPSVQLAAETATGVVVPMANISITVAIGANPSGGTLSGSLTAPTNASGVATFAGLSIDKVGVGYTLSATSTGLTPATSSTFTVSVGPPAKLIFSTSPTNSFASGAFYNQPVIAVEDAGNNVVGTASNAVTLTITTPAGATLSCTAAKSADAGVATFSGCSINAVGIYTLTATSGSLASGISASFTVVAAPTNLAWSGSTTTVCGAPTGTSFAQTYTGCTFLIIDIGSFTSSVALTNSAGTAVTNLGAAITITWTPQHGTVTSATMTIAHGQSISSATSTFNPQYPLVVTDQVTVSATSLLSATAVLHS